MDTTERLSYIYIYIQERQKIHTCTCTRAKSLQLCPTLCNAMDYSPPGSFHHGILQARILEWAPCLPPGVDPPGPREQIHVSYISCIGRLVLYHKCHLGSPRHTHISPLGLNQTRHWFEKGFEVSISQESQRTNTNLVLEWEIVATINCESESSESISK